MKSYIESVKWWWNYDKGWCITLLLLTAMILAFNAGMVFLFIYGIFFR